MAATMRPTIEQMVSPKDNGRMSIQVIKIAQLEKRAENYFLTLMILATEMVLLSLRVLSQPTWAGALMPP